jgi:signal transduction histidine kinase
MNQREDTVVAMLTRVLEINWIILYFVYGLVFFVTGLVTGLQWRRQSDLDLARPLPWLAAFGIAHGFNEWGHVFIPLQALYLADSVVRLMVIAHLLLLAVSFFFLFQFGVELLLPLLSRQKPWGMSLHRWLRAMPAIMFIIWGVAMFLRGALTQDPLNVLIATGNAWSRYFLCFPGAILASIGLFRQARQMRELELPRIAIYLTGAAVAFLVYALVGGLLVPTGPVFPANLVNYSLLDRTLQIPAPVFRSLCGLAMAFFVVRSLDVFQVEVDRRLAEMEQAQILAADRERIGRELHDGIVQNIYAAGLGLEEAHHLAIEDSSKAQQQIRAVMDSLNRTIHDIRRYIFDLQIAEQSRELEIVLENLVQDLRLDTFLDVHLEVEGQRCCWLDSEQVAHITQIAREALSNVTQHAHATQVTVNLGYLGNATQLTVGDNGRGIAPDALTGNGHQGQGMANMRKRARLLGGDLVIQGKPGQGLRLELTIPCDGRKDLEPALEAEESWA